jgi:hypothetical protein
MKLRFDLLLVLLICDCPAASVFFSQAVDAGGTLTGGLTGTGTLPIYAPIRETADSQILGYAEVTVGASSPTGQVTSYPRTDGTDTYIYQQVNAGVNAFASLDFRFVSSDGLNLPMPGTTISVSELFIRVDGRPLTTGGGYVTVGETNTLTLSGLEAATWEVVSDLGIVEDTISEGVLTYTVSDTLDDPAEFIQWRAFDPEGDDSITGFTWRLDNDVASLNATHLQLDLSPIPEPAPALLGALGLVGLLCRRRV